MASKILKASFQGAGKFKLNFPSAKGLMPISVGQFYHEDDYLIEHLKLLNANFSSCDIVICDTLQRHTLSFYMRNSESIDYYETSKANGEAWLVRNKSKIDVLNIPINITYWDFWLGQLQYPIVKAKIDSLIEKDLQMKLAFHTTAENFVSRFIERTKINLNTHQINKATQASLNYLLEECVVMVLWTKLNTEFIS